MKTIGKSRLVTCLSLSLVFTGLISAQSQAALIAYWRFESANFLGDSSGNGHTLTSAPKTLITAGGPTTGTDALPAPSAAGYVNVNNKTGSLGAASFNSTLEQSAITVNTLGLNSHSQVTLEWFARATVTESEHYPWFSGNPTDVNAGTGNFSFASQGLFRDFGATNLSTTVDNAWHQYTVTLDRTGGSGMRLYKDYTLVDSTATIPAAFNNTTIVLGKDYYGQSGAQGRFFNGLLDEFSISTGILVPGQFLSQQLPPVPEPSTFALLGLGAIGLAMKTRRRTRCHLIAASSARALIH